MNPKLATEANKFLLQLRSDPELCFEPMTEMLEKAGASYPKFNAWKQQLPDFEWKFRLLRSRLQRDALGMAPIEEADEFVPPWINTDGLDENQIRFLVYFDRNRMRTEALRDAGVSTLEFEVWVAGSEAFQREWVRIDTEKRYDAEDGLSIKAGEGNVGAQKALAGMADSLVEHRHSGAIELNGSHLDTSRRLLDERLKSFNKDSPKPIDVDASVS